MVRLLLTEKAVQSAYYGFMFSVYAFEDMDVLALHAMSEVNMNVNAKIYAANGAWEACKASQSSWSEVGEASFSEVRKYILR